MKLGHFIKPQSIISKPLSSMLVLVFLSLTSCKAVGPDYKRPEAQLPETFKSTSSELADKVEMSEWWKLFQDPVLNDLVDQSLKNNTDIKQAIARIEASDAYLKQVGAALYPEVDLSGGANRSRISQLGPRSIGTSNPESGDYKALIGTSFELDFWGKLRRAKESARAQALSSRYAKSIVDTTLEGLVASNYIQLRSLDAQIKVSKDNLKNREDNLNLTQIRMEGGISSALDVNQSKVSVSNLVASISDLVRQRVITENLLARLTGDMNLKIESSDSESLPIAPTPPAGLPSSLLESRPDILQAEENMIAANANIGVAKAALFPTISLTANYGGESAALGDILKSASRLWTAGLNLDLPIFDSGRLSAQVEQASSIQKQALATYQGSIQTAFQEVNDALVSARQNAERENALNNSQESAKKALEIAQNRYVAGYNSYLDVLDSERVYNDSSIAFIQSRQARLQASVDLFKALGGGWERAQYSNKQ